MLDKALSLEFSKYLEQLNPHKKKHLLNQVNSLDSNDLEAQRHSFEHPVPIIQKDWEDFKGCSIPSPTDALLGKKAYEEGKVAFVILAGGQGIRLGSDKPKGCLPITTIKKKSLFQIFSEKIFYAQRSYNQEFDVVLLVSIFNGKETEQFFLDNHYFGLNPLRVHFVYQSHLPVLDEKGSWQLAKDDELYLAPNGNGQVFMHLQKKGFLEKWQHEKIESVILFSIDNPLSDPFNEEFLGLHLREKNNLTLQAIPQEKNCGALVTKDQKITVLEYLYTQEKDQYSFCNTNFFCFSLPFTQIMAKNDAKTGYHLVKKKAEIYSENKIQIKEIYKSEKFLFDHFIYASKAGAVLHIKEKCFAPLKSKEDVGYIQQILLKRDEERFLYLFKREPLKKVFELSQEFYYLTPRQIDALQKKSIAPKGYLDVPPLE